MSGRGRGGASSYQSTGSEDEGREVELGKRKRKPRNKKHIQEKRFVIHPGNLCTTRSELCQAQRDINGCTTIPIHDSKSEREIRETLVEKLPKLRGKRFQFFTKGDTGNYFCPCSRECLDATHRKNPISEWNGKNVKKMARGNRVVYILCEETAMTGGHDDGTSSFDSTQVENVIPQNVAQGGTNVATSSTARQKLLPRSACKDNLTEEEISSLVDTITLRDHNQKITRNDSDSDDDNADDGNSDDDDDDEDESEEEKEESLLLPPATQRQMHTDVETLVENPSMHNPENVSNGGCASGITDTEIRMEPDSAYNTLPTGSNTSLFTLGSTRQSQLAFSSPLNTPTEMAGGWRNQERTRPVTSVIISDITPTGGSVVGGYNFFLTLDPVGREFTGQYRVMFGNIPPVPTERISHKILQGTVPPSPRAGDVEVKVLNSSGETVSDQTDAVLFTYLVDKKDKLDKERRRKRKNYLKGEINSTADAVEMLSLVIEVVKEVESDTKEGDGSNGNGKEKALYLLRMIAESAAKINAMEFFTIIFSTPVGRTVFKSFKDEEILLEDVARENGHEELACFLQERHLMYRDDENDSDDEVDWDALAKAAKEYQRRNVGRETTESTSSEVSNGYCGDVENLSEHDEVVETCFVEPTVKQKPTSDAKCEEETHTLLPEVESVPELKGSLPKLSDPIVGRDGECNKIIDNLASNQWRLGVISGPLGIGKTSVAVEVGHKLLLNGWNVCYHACTNQNLSSELGVLLENHCHCPELESDLICDHRNEKCPVQDTCRTLLILDQLENAINADEAETLQRFVSDTLDQVHCLQVLLVTRKRIDLKVDFAFYLKLEPLKSAVAVQLLQSVSQITSIANLEVIAKGCGYNPLAIMIVRALIQKGISEHDIINMLLSSDNFWKKLSHNVVRRHLLKENETLVNDDQSMKPLSSLFEIQTTDQKQMTVNSASIHETKCTDVDKILSQEKTSDPRYCHCRLCMNSDGTSNLTLALESSAFFLGLTLEDLKDVIQDKDLLQKGDLQIGEGENPRSKGKNERTGPLLALLLGLKILLSGSSIQHPIFYLKKALKKAKKRVPRSCGYRPLCRTKSYASLDEGGISLPFVTEREPTTNIDKKEPVEQIKDHRAPFTCVGKPLLRSTPCLNAEGDIIAAPSEFEELPSRKKKAKQVTSVLKDRKIKSSILLLWVAIFLSFCVGGIFYISSSKGQEPVNDPALEVNQSTVFTTKVTSARTTIGTFPIVPQADHSVPSGDSPHRSIFPTSSRCRSNELELVDHSCWPCPKCPPGLEVSPPCGSRLSLLSRYISCKSCEAGKTFSSSWNETSCKSCSQCAPNETVVRRCKPSSDVVCSRCQPNQISWISTTEEKHECLDCPICPPGFEPSHPCGSTVPYGVLITCVKCREGETFSAQTDRKQCKRCSPCGARQRLIARCTKYFDTICGSISSAKCRYDQIQLNQLDSLNRTQKTCMDCPMCPAGTELSKPCGTVAYRQIDILCVPCRPGFTYSDQPSKEGCKPCKSCSPDAVVISHCSVLRDTVCSTNLKCSSNQISFSNGSTLTCVDCIECSVGEEPSIACGSLLTVLPRQQCVSCKPGTFSDIYGTQPCRPCQSCDKEELVKRKCTQASDTVCFSCEANQYFDHELWSCAPCSTCCKDENDRYPQECAHLTRRKCKLRICLPNSFQSIKAVSATTMKTTTAVPASKTKILVLSTLIVLMLIVFTTVFIFTCVRLRSFRQRQLHLTFRKTQKKRWQDVAGEFTLEELSARHMEVYEWMCRKLDRGLRRDYERLAKRFDLISPGDRDSLRREPSPSRCLLTLIETLYPSLTLGDLVTSLQEIGRNDIANRLIPLALRSNRKTGCWIEEQCVEF